MVLKAIFLDFSGIIIRDADLKQWLMDDILISENLRPDPTEFSQVCIGRSDRACLKQLLTRRGRVAPEALLSKLLAQRSARYIEALSARKKLPLYPELQDFLYPLKTASPILGLVTGTERTEVDWVLEQANLTDQFGVLVTGSDLTADEDKPAPKAYELAIAQLNRTYPELAASPQECLAIEASFSGIAAARQAGIPVIGVAHLYPYRMMQRRANWAVDYLNEIDLEWILPWYSPTPVTARESGSPESV